MDPELKALIESLQKAHEEFKKANDENLKKADAVTTEKVEKLNAELTRLTNEIKSVQQRQEQAEIKSQRPILGMDGNPLSAEQGEHKAGFESFMRKGNDAGLRELERKAMTVGSDPDGGYLVPVEVEQNIDRVLGIISAMRRLARVQPIGAASYKKPVKTGGASYSWAGETTAPSETGTPTLVELEFTPGKVEAEPYATQELLEDAAVDIGAWLMEEVTLAFGEGEGAAFINGNGVRKPRGLLSYDTVANASYAWGKLGYVTSGAAGDFAASYPSDKLIDLVHSLKSGYRNGANWMMNDATLGKIRKFKDGQGNYLWVPGLKEGPAGSLLGYGVETDDNMPDVAANAFPIAFADFKRAYIIIDRRGIVVLRDPLTSKPYTKFYTTKRVGGGVQNFEAVKLLKIAA